MKAQTAQLLIDIEKLFIKYTPWLVIASMILLVSIFGWKIHTLRTINNSWDISIMEPTTEQVMTYTAYSEPIVRDNKVTFTNDKGETIQLPYKQGTAIIIKECEEDKNDNATRE